MAVGEGAVWAMSDSQATLMRIDPARNAVVARIKVYPPEAVAAGDGGVWLSNPSDDTVTRIDPATNKVTATIHVGPQSRGHRRLAGRRLGRKRGRPERSHGSIPRRIESWRRSAWTEARLLRGAHERDRVAPRRLGGAVAREKHRAQSIRRRTAWSRPRALDVSAVRVPRRRQRPASGRLALRRRRGRAESTLARTKLTAELAEVDPVGLEVAFGSVWVADRRHRERRSDRPAHGPARGEAARQSASIVRLGAGFGSVWVNDDFGRVLRIKPQR